MRLIRKLWLGLALLLASLALASPAHAEWREASSDNFVIYADADEAWLRNFATRLERFDASLRRRWGLTDRPRYRSNRLTIYVVADLEVLSRMARRRAGVAGFYIARASGSLAFTPRKTVTQSFADVVLFHEYTHHFLSLNFPAVYPPWFTEGFAEFHSTAAILADGAVRTGDPPQFRAYGLLYDSQYVSIERLLGINLTPFRDVRQIDVFYGRSWALMHMLYFDDKRRGQLNDYVRRINSGVGFGDAATQVFGDLRQLNRDLGAYVRQRQLRATTTQAAALPIGQIAIRLLSEGQARMMPHRMVSDRGVTEREAAALVDPARRVAALHPGDAAVQAALAEIEFDAGNLNEAEAAANRALAADPRNIDAMLYKGQVLAARAAAGGAQGRPLWAAARNAFIDANQIDPEAAEPLMHFYLTFRAEGREPTANAIAGLARAFQLAPHDDSLRLMYARELLFAGEPARARRALEPLAYAAHRDKEAEVVRQLIVRIDAGEAPRAIAASMAADVPKDTGTDSQARAPSQR